MRLLEPLTDRMVKRMLVGLPQKMQEGIDAADRGRTYATSA
jgi:hypothetical protein